MSATRSGRTATRWRASRSRSPGLRQRRSGAFPNLLESVVIRGNIAYVPNTCSSPNGPFRFNVNVQSCLSSINTLQDTEAFPDSQHERRRQLRAGRHEAVQYQSVRRRLQALSRGGFVALAATDRLLRVTLDGQGLPTINPPANASRPGQHRPDRAEGPGGNSSSPTRTTRSAARTRAASCINSTDTRAYVMDFVSRDVAVVDISGADPTQYKTLVRMQSAALPAAGSQGAIVQRGKQLFNSAIGPEGALDNSKRPAGRMSDTGWGTLLQLSSPRPHRHRDVDVRGWSAAGDLDGKHVRVRRRR